MRHEMLLSAGNSSSHEGDSVPFRLQPKTWTQIHFFIEKGFFPEELYLCYIDF